MPISFKTSKSNVLVTNITTKDIFIFLNNIYTRVIIIRHRCAISDEGNIFFEKILFP